MACKYNDPSVFSTEAALDLSRLREIQHDLADLRKRLNSNDQSIDKYRVSKTVQKLEREKTELYNKHLRLAVDNG